MSKQTVKLTESQLVDLIENVIKEDKAEKAGKPFNKGTSKKTGDADQPFTQKAKKRKTVKLTETELIDLIERVVRESKVEKPFTKNKGDIKPFKGKAQKSPVSGNVVPVKESTKKVIPLTENDLVNIIKRVSKEAK